MNTLITIPFSHFCEKARWALDLGLALGATPPYREEGHLPFFSRRFTRPHGGKTTPLLVADGEVIPDSTDILRWVDGRLPEGKHLYPPEVAAEVLAFEDELDRRFGVDVRRVAYFHLMADPRVLSAFFDEAPVPAREQRMLRLPPIRGVAFYLMRRGLGIDANRAERSTRRLLETLDTVGERLGHRPYLFGATFTAADLTLAALASPLLMPPQYPLAWPDRDRLPGPLRELMSRAAETRAGQHVLAMYRRHR